MSNEKTAPTNASQPNVSQPKTASPPHFHGGLRGLDSTPSSPQFEGRYGRMLRTPPAAKFSVNDLKRLAEKMVAGPEVHPTPETQVDEEENTGIFPNSSDPALRGISAGHTYLGQFIDHDITFDPVSSLDKQNDPDSLV